MAAPALDSIGPLTCAQPVQPGVVSPQPRPQNFYEPPPWPVFSGQNLGPRRPRSPPFPEASPRAREASAAPGLHGRTQTDRSSARPYPASELVYPTLSILESTVASPRRSPAY